MLSSLENQALPDTTPQVGSLSPYPVFFDLRYLPFSVRYCSFIVECSFMNLGWMMLLWDLV